MPASAELRQQIEDLALKLVIGAPETGVEPSDWIPALERIREDAIREQADDVVEAAVVAIDALRSSSDHADAAEVVAAGLQDSIARLQRTVDAGPSRPAVDAMPAQDPELLADFVLESREHLTSIEAQVLTIERDPSDSEALNAVFRGFHTIKGLAGFLELWEVQRLAHEVETVLDRARNAQLTITPAASRVPTTSVLSSPMTG